MSIPVEKGESDMRKMKIQKISSVLVVLLVLSVASGQEKGIEAVTEPSKDVTMAFVRPGRINVLHVKIGQKVKAGQILAELENAAEKIQLAQYKEQAEDKTPVNVRQAGLDQAKVEFEMTKEAHKTGAATKLELAQARLKVTMAQAELVLSKFQRKMAGYKFSELEKQMARMKLFSPTDGTVEKVEIDAGETVDMQMDTVVQIVQIDPLWIKAFVPLREGRKLRVGQDVLVDFAAGHDETRKGKIMHVASVAEVGALLVRVEVANPSCRPAGENVKVRFSNIDSQSGK